jgi:hypothetical protein
MTAADGCFWIAELGMIGEQKVTAKRANQTLFETYTTNLYLLYLFERRSPCC